MKDEIEECAYLESLVHLTRYERRIWPIDEEPTYLDKSEYVKTTRLVTCEPIWEESDKSIRDRITKNQLQDLANHKR